MTGVRELYNFERQLVGALQAGGLWQKHGGLR